MKKLAVYLLTGALGGVLYYGIELLYRGYSHMSMFLLGGAVFLFCGLQGRAVWWQDSLGIQLIRCAVFITATEFATGVIVNKWMELSIWDYTQLPLNLWGQVCLPFIMIFTGLCMIAIPISGYFLYWMLGDKKPELGLLQIPVNNKI